MKKKTLVIIVSILLVVVFCTVSVIVLLHNKTPHKDSMTAGEELSTESVLSFLSKEDIDNYIDGELEKDSFDYCEDNYCYLSNVTVLDNKSDVEIILDGKKIDALTATIEFYFKDISEGDKSEENDEKNEDDVEPITPTYSFSEKERNEIENKYNIIKNSFERFLKCGEIKTYDLIATHNEDSVSKDEAERFYSGDAIKELSVMDDQNILWLFRFEASNGSASVTILKIINQSEYSGFIPIIDMRHH